MAASLRVAFYTDAREVGGAERSLANLVAAVSPSIEVAVVGVERHVVAEVVGSRRGVRGFVVPFVSSRWDLASIRAHLRVLAALRPHVFHANLISPWSCQMAILLAVLAPRVRVVAVEQLPCPPAEAGQLLVKRLTSAGLAAHVAVGARSAAEVERLVGLRAGSVRTIYNGVPDRRPTGAAARTGSGAVVGAMGRLEPQKGFDVLLRALVELPEASAVIVGDGGEREALERLAAELGVSRRVAFVGWSDAPRAELGSFHVLALPSRFEGFPLVVVEAMLDELPVVASDVGSVAEAVRHGQTGLLVNPDDPPALADALRELLADEERRLAMGRRGRSLALERYTASAMARGYESLYAEICGRAALGTVISWPDGGDEPDRDRRAHGSG